MNWAYLVRCHDGTLYAGWTTDVTARVAAHNSGKGAKYTRGRGPVALVYAEQFATKSEALRQEAALKKMSRAEKEWFIAAHKRRK